MRILLATLLGALLLLGSAGATAAQTYCWDTACAAGTPAADCWRAWCSDGWSYPAYPYRAPTWYRADAPSAPPDRTPAWFREITPLTRAAACARGDLVAQLTAC